MKSQAEIDQLKLRRLIQRLKSLILTDLSPQERNRIKTELTDLDEKYTKNEIFIGEYKQKSLTLLLKYWHDVARSEQFLYRESGNFLTQAEKFQICEFLQNLQD